VARQIVRVKGKASARIHLRERIKILRRAIHLARGVTIVKNSASTTKYEVAITKTAHLTIRFTLIPGVAVEFDRANETVICAAGG
jgi:hypothetical protein